MHKNITLLYANANAVLAVEKTGGQVNYSKN
jgi:hypothetical protein